MNAVSNVRAMRDIEPSPLLTAIRNAVLAVDHATLCLHGTATPEECDKADDAVWDARQNLLAEFAAMGVTQDWARKIGGVL